jgi:hypothetical protein
MICCIFSGAGCSGCVHLSETRSATQAILDFNAHYHNGSLKCGSILKRWVKWFHYIFKMAFKKDLCGVYTVGSYYGIRYVKESVFLLFLPYFVLFYILHSFISPSQRPISKTDRVVHI